MELDQLPVQIEALESQQLMLSNQLADPVIYKGDPAISVGLKKQALAIDLQIKTLMERWEFLLHQEK